MKFNNSVAINYVSQIYVVFIGIFIFPIYLRFFGAEKFGLLSFFNNLLIWFQLLDTGISGTLLRQTSQFLGKAISKNELLQILRYLEFIFFIIGAIAIIFINFFADFVINNWLGLQGSLASEGRTAFILISLIVFCRLFAALYRSGLYGLEKIVFLSSLNAILATLRFVVIIPLVMFFLKDNLMYYFIYQLCIAILELCVNATYFYRNLAKDVESETTNAKFLGKAKISQIVKFSMSIALTSSLWVAVTQLDKLILSTLIPLADYGYFSLVLVVAGAVNLAVNPFSTTIIPKLSRLEAENNQKDFFVVYRNYTKIISMISGSLASIFIIFPYEILESWTKNSELAAKMSPILAIYALGNFILSFSAFPYYLQYAKGNMRLHITGAILYSVFYLIFLFFLVQQYQVLGAALAWLFINMLYFLVWIPIIHKKFANNLNFSWQKNDVFQSIFPNLVGITILFPLRQMNFEMSYFYGLSLIMIILIAFLHIKTIRVSIV